MNKGNFFRRAVSTLFIVSILLFSAVTHAEIYTGEGSYVMSEGENLGVAKERAKADAMRNASEQAGIYVKSYARMRNFELEEDIVETMTANILKLIGNPNFSPLKEVDNLEGVLIHVVVKVQIDDSDIIRWLNKSEQEKSELVSQMEALRKANEEQARQIEELKRQLAQSTTKEEKERITKDFANEDKIFLSNQKVEEGWKVYEKEDFNGAKNLFNEAINLNPQNAQAWYGRGMSYHRLRKYEHAIQDCDKAIEINPNYINAYNGRYHANAALGQYDLAIQDLNKMIELFPERAVNLYLELGLLYLYEMENPEQALITVNKAIELDPNDAFSYRLRGECYEILGDKEKAQIDFAKNKELKKRR